MSNAKLAKIGHEMRSDMSRRTKNAKTSEQMPWRKVVFGAEFSPLGEVRKALLECTVTAAWTFLSIGSTVSVLWSCNNVCSTAIDVANQGMDDMQQSNSMMSDMHNDTMSDMPTGRRLAMASMCPPPTMQIVVGLVRKS